jgi:hypothetical protein
MRKKQAHNMFRDIVQHHELRLYPIRLRDSWIDTRPIIKFRPDPELLAVDRLRRDQILRLPQLRVQRTPSCRFMCSH